MNNSNSRLMSLAFALVITVVQTGLIMLITNLTYEGSIVHRVFVGLGGHMPDGMIQAITFFLFYFGILEVRRMMKDTTHQEKAFDMKLLPEKEHYVLNPDEVNQIRLKVTDLGQTDNYHLVDLIKKACTKFRANKSASEALAVVSAQANINVRNSDSEQSLLRYVLTAIPSVGFIGTVIGIALSLGKAERASEAGGIKEITTLLEIAFDTTLVALFLSILLMYFYHNMQERVEKSHTRMESYIIENLINRIYVPKGERETTH
jgi:biopolymer transport protein ExbB/TolQ